MRYRVGMWIRRFPLVLFVVALAVPCGAGEEGTPVCGVTVVNSYPHDPGAFTQGLFFADGFLYEGTGRHGQSSLRRIDLETGAVVQEQELAEEFFGEGIVRRLLDGMRPGWNSDLQAGRERRSCHAQRSMWQCPDPAAA